MEIKDLQIAVDFDGTLTKGNYYPAIGDIQQDGINFLKDLQNLGAKIYLDTMRSGQDLINAIKVCKHYGLEFDSVGPNLLQFGWTDSNKCHADFAIDDRNLGTPLKYDENGKPYVNWKLVRRIFKERFVKELKNN